jgi:hypothetical protein
MSTPLVGSGAGASDAFLPATGFGPGSIIIAIVGGVLTLSGFVARRLARRQPAA